MFIACSTVVPESCPQCLNLGGTLARCGMVQDRNYDAPKNALGGPMPTKIQATYSQGQDIIINITLTAHHKGHFVFSGCPIVYGEVAGQPCFDQYKLTFVEDLLYGANFDFNNPERAFTGGNLLACVVLRTNTFYWYIFWYTYTPKVLFNIYVTRKSRTNNSTNLFS